MYKRVGEFGLELAKRTGLVQSQLFRKAVFTGIGAVAPERVQVTVGAESKMEIDPSDPAELLYLFDYSSHEAGVTEIIRESLNEESTFLDIGAFLGYYTLISCEEINNGTVVAFEPFPEHYDRVRKNIGINGYDAYVEPIALSDEIGESSISESGSPTLREAGNTDVMTSTLDEYVLKNDLSIDVMKVDIEGAEHQLIRGAERTLQEQDLTLLLELHSNKLEEMGSSAANVLQHLDRMGYCLEKLPEREEIPPTDIGDLGKENEWISSNPHVVAKKP